MATPVLFFSDLLSGPKSGWEGSATKGAAVTIWGLNLGSSQGTSTVNCCGQTLSAGTNVPEWGASGVGLGIPRGLQRITFYLNSSMNNGAGSITVTVNGQTSNALAFTIRAGNIYFVSVADGSDSFNGTKSTNQGTPNGPWRNILKISPSNNSVLRPGDCIYVRGGNYTQLDDQAMFAHFRASTYTIGSASSPYAVAAYPAEIPVFNGTSATRGFNYPEGTKQDYWTYSKLKFLNGYNATASSGQGTRIIGTWMQDMTADAWTGVIWVTDSQNTKIYGNYWDNCGHDKYKHNIYAKTQPNGTGTIPVQNLDIGWNEFSRPVSAEGYGGCVFLSKSSDSGSIGDTLNVYIHDSYWHGGNCGDWIYVGDGTRVVGEVYIYNNLFVGGTVTNHGSIFWAGGAGNGYIYNNTFYLVAPGMPTIFYSNSGFGAGGTVQCKNNIYYNAAGQAFFGTESGNSHVVQSDHDHFYQSGTTTIPSGIANLTVTSATSGNPLFATAGSDFHLQSSSPCKDAGVSVISVVTTDYEGITRPQNSVFDKGAYEFVTGGSSIPPAIPTGLHIV